MICLEFDEKLHFPKTKVILRKFTCFSFEYKCEINSGANDSIGNITGDIRKDLCILDSTWKVRPSIHFHIIWLAFNSSVISFFPYLFNGDCNSIDDEIFTLLVNDPRGEIHFKMLCETQPKCEQERTFFLQSEQFFMLLWAGTWWA